MEKIAKIGKNSIVTKMFISLVIVMTFNVFVSTIVGLTDGLCISWLVGNNGTAAYTAASPFSQITFGICNFISVGMQVVITKLLARGKKKEADSLFSLVFALAIVLSVVVFVFCFFGSDLISQFIGASKANPEVGSACSSYIRGIAIGFPFMLISQMLLPIVLLDGNKKISQISMFSTLILNVGLDVIFAEFFANKMFGVGLAASLSNVASVVILSFHFIRRKNYIKFTFKNWEFKRIGDVAVSGVPSLIKDVVITLRVFIINYIMISLGQGYVAQVMAIRGCESAFTNLFDSAFAGLIGTTVILAGIFYGEEDESSLDCLLHLVIKYSLIVCGIVSVVYFFLSKSLASFYGMKDAQMIEYAEFAMKVKAPSLIFSSFNVAMLGVLQGSKRTVLASLSTFFQSLFFQVIFMHLFTTLYFDPIRGMWIGEVLGFVAYTFVHIVVAAIYSRHFPYKARHLFFLPKSFGYKKNDTIEFKVTSIMDAMELQKQVLIFCDEHGVDSKRKEHLAACVEELGILIVTSGFIIDRKKHLMLVRVLYKNGELILRTRDDCDKFNINLKNEKIESNEDKTHNIAIRMILKLAKSVDYVKVLKTNNLIIKL